MFYPLDRKVENPFWSQDQLDEAVLVNNYVSSNVERILEGKTSMWDELKITFSGRQDDCPTKLSQKWELVDVINGVSLTGSDLSTS